MSEPFLGEVDLFGFNFVPENWGQCDGTLVQISSKQALYSLIGAWYGGDGRTTFALPDLRGKAAVSWGTPQGSIHEYVVGETKGSEMLSLTSDKLTEHSHTASFSSGSSNASLKVSTASANKNVPSDGYYLASATLPIYSKTPGTDTVALGGVTGGGIIEGSVALDASGAGRSFLLMQPFQTLNYCMALEGVFPSRN